MYQTAYEEGHWQKKEVKNHIENVYDFLELFIWKYVYQIYRKDVWMRFKAAHSEINTKCRGP